MKASFPYLLFASVLCVGCQKNAPPTTTDTPVPETPATKEPTKKDAARLTFRPDFPELKELETYATLMNVSPDGLRVIVAAMPLPMIKNARVIELATQKELDSFVTNVDDLGFAGDKAVVYQKGVGVYHPLGGGKDVMWPGATGYRMELSPSGDRAAFVRIGSPDVTVWDATTGKGLYSKMATAEQLPALSNFFDKGQKIATSDGQAITIRNVDEGEEIKKVDTRGKLKVCVNSWLAVSSDGKYVAGIDESLCVWEVSSGKLVHEIPKNKLPLNIWRTGFVPNTHVLAVPLSDHSVSFVDVTSGQARSPLVGHQRPVTIVVFESTGKTAVTMDDRGGIKVWDLP